MRITWTHHPPTDELAYERLRRSLVESARDSDDGWSSLDYIGCVREGWSCDELPGLSIHKLQTNPGHPISAARWTYVARHWIDLPDDQLREDICTADTLDEAKAAGEHYLATHVGFAFTTRFRSEYHYDLRHEPKAVH